MENKEHIYKYWENGGWEYKEGANVQATKLSLIYFSIRLIQLVKPGSKSILYIKTFTKIVILVKA